MNLAEATAQADIVYPGCASVLVLSAAYRGWQLRRQPDNHPLRVLTAYLAIIACAFTCAVPALYVRIDALAGIANLATLLVYGFIMLGVATNSVMLAYWALPVPQARIQARVRIAASAVTLAAMAVLFLASSAVHDPEHPVDFDIHYATAPSAAAMLLLYLVVFLATLLDLAVRANRFARAAGRPQLRHGLRLVAIGAVIATGYNITKIATIVAAWFLAEPARLEPWNAQVGPAFASLGAVLIVCGWTLPAWRPGTSRIARLRTYLQIRPLWLALYAAHPQIALHPPTSWLRDWWAAVRDVDFRLYRQVIEIGDGRLALRAYLDPAVARAAAQAACTAGLHGPDLDAVVEASLLAGALAARAGHRPQPSVGDHDHDHDHDTVHRDDTLAAETEWLRRVARAFTTSPIVSAVRHRTDRSEGQRLDHAQDVT